MKTNSKIKGKTPNQRDQMWEKKDPNFSKVA